MSPKEKGVELYWKYYQLVADCSHPEEKAKESALIAVDEIIQVTAPYLDRHEDYYQQLKIEMTSGYWQEVKQEIEKL